MTKTSKPKRRPSRNAAQEALKRRAGIFAHAAEDLNIDRSQLVRMVIEMPELQLTRREAEELIKDMAEANLFSDIQKGGVESSKFLLERKGRDRGYGKVLEARLDADQMDALLLGLSGNNLEELLAIKARLEEGS